MCKKHWRAYVTPVAHWWIALPVCLYSFALTRMSFRDFPLRYDMSGGSVKISLSCGWLCMRCHFLISNAFKLGKARWYCVTKGNIPVRASLFFCLPLSDAFRSLNLTSERCFSTILVGYPLFGRRFSKFFIFSSKVNCEEFLLRSPNASPLIKPFVTPGGWHEEKFVYWKFSVGL